MKKIIWVMLCSALSLLSFATDPREYLYTEPGEYLYEIDLIKTQDDRVRVNLQVPQIKQKEIKFYLPKIVPGTYSISDFGRMVSEFKCWDEHGNSLHAERLDINTFLIHDAHRLYSLSYLVDDTFDKIIGPKIYGMSGTNIEADKNFLINPFGFFGYFEGMKDEKFTVQIKHSADMYGSSALTPVKRTPKLDVFQSERYHHLADHPIMYCKPDTSTVKVENTDVLVSVYAPQNLVKSDYVLENYSKLLEVQKDYMGGELPVDQYAFLMYFLQSDQAVMTGALEHNTSSVYVLPEYPQEMLLPTLMHIGAHEFFHIITPLNIHSDKIADYDFNDPQLSKHLWMYEGTTEYFAHHAQLVGGLTTLDQFLASMGQKIIHSHSIYDDELPFTKLSTGCLHDHSDQYGNVYEKGALISLCLDVLLRQESNGEMGMIDLMNELGSQFGPNEPFKDQRLFKIIKKKSSPAVRKFLRKYVENAQDLPLEESFKALGIKYTAPKPYQDFSLGNVGFAYDPDKQGLVINNAYQMNEVGKDLGYEVGDQITSINGIPYDGSNIGEYFNKVKETMKVNHPLEVEVIRDKGNGKTKEMTLTTVTKKVTKYSPADFEIEENLTAEQKELRMAWLSNAKKPMKQ